jgi:hypothetical protein
MSSFKKKTCKGTFRQVFICLRPGPLSSYDPIPLRLIYVYTVTYSHREGGGENGTREKVRGAKVYKAGSKIPA